MKRPRIEVGTLGFGIKWWDVTGRIGIAGQMMNPYKPFLSLFLLFASLITRIANLQTWFTGLRPTCLQMVQFWPTRMADSWKTKVAGPFYPVIRSDLLRVSQPHAREPTIGEHPDFIDK